MGQFLQGRNFGCFVTFLGRRVHLVKQKPNPTCYLQLSPTIAPIWNYSKRAQDFDCISRFWDTTFYVFSNIYRPYLKLFERGLLNEKLPIWAWTKSAKKNPGKLLPAPCPIHPHLGNNAYLNRPYYHYWILWLYIVEFPATFTFHCL